MRVIDLLNKIANGESLPDEIKVECVNGINKHNCYYHFSPIFESYINDDNTLIQNATNLATLINLEIEIIEENKKIEKIKNMNCDIICSSCDDGAVMIHDLSNLEIALDLKTLRNKLNDVIKKLNALEDD